eukprot:3037353-Amphidinium_carterae.1
MCQCCCALTCGVARHSSKRNWGKRRLREQMIRSMQLPLWEEVAVVQTSTDGGGTNVDELEDPAYLWDGR